MKRLSTNKKVLNSQKVADDDETCLVGQEARQSIM